MRPVRRLRDVLLLTAVALVPIVGVISFYTVGGSGRTGADEQARQVVVDLHGYRPWFEPLWSPPTPTLEALLFIGQAAAGAALLCFAIVRLHARRTR
jgi:cobalt/nickel transport protein